MKKREFNPVREIAILIVAWLMFIGSISMAAKRPPEPPSDEQISATTSAKETLIREFDTAFSKSESDIFYAKKSRRYYAREIACLLSAAFFGALTFAKGYEISDQTDRPALWGGVIALLSGPLCFALHVKPK